MRVIHVLWAVVLLGCSSSKATSSSKADAAVPGSDASADASPGDAGDAGTSQAKAFALTQANDPQIPTLLSHPGIDGVALQLGWSQYEQSDGQFSWSGLDTVLAEVGAKGKQATLHFYASSKPPAWLEQAGAQMYSYQDLTGKSVTEPVPWDPVFLAEYSAFLSALATHLQKTGELAAVFDVSVSAPVSEMNLVGCRNGMLGTSVTYNRASYLQAWETMIDAYQSSFPNKAKFVSPPVAGLICAPAVDKTFYTDLMSYAKTKGSNFWIFAADLTSQGSQRVSDYTSLLGTFPLGYQTIWSSTNDPSNRMKGSYPTNLEQAACFALDQGASYLEIYAADVLNTNATIQSAITAIHDPAQCTP